MLYLYKNITMRRLFFSLDLPLTDTARLKIKRNCETNEEKYYTKLRTQMKRENDSTNTGEKEAEVPIKKFLFVLAVFVILSALLYFGRLLVHLIIR